jgi:hypothetical protein
MSVESLSPRDIEEERQRQARELAADSGEDWAPEYQPGSAGCHELLDRAALLTDMLERYLLDHPTCISRREWYLLAEQAAAALRELYQQVGAEHLAADMADRQPDSKEIKGTQLGANT